MLKLEYYLYPLKKKLLENNLLVGYLYFILVVYLTFVKSFEDIKKTKN